ncbi:hypothetical protein OIU80_19340 [Flavobacterium sp. LS1R47]|uniref:Uncharacterized protein n=1 Tax=Flavobacterium frigoritolerans TaxID=2987686 RepID=A0A9X3CA61_9FLAO|nr:hypothetical protein [Flavobacterium frigoritolerans]MCV9934440.1 hypothetical protein [Flavobacterium frigoritolerans]
MSKKKEKAKIEKEWTDFRNAVYETKSKSQDDFEKYINLIASGGLGLTIAFFDKIVQIDIAIYLFIIVLGWFLLALTLLLNLISHFKSVKYNELTILEINDKEYEKVFINVEKRNRIINRLNGISLISLITGVLLIIIFVTINIYKMNSNKPNPNQQPKPSTEEKLGRTTPPPPNKPSTNPQRQ